MNYPTEKQAQERTLALLCWQKAQALADINAINQRIRKRQLVKFAIGIMLTSLACFFIGRELYLYFFWY